ncbi:MAG TPA: hypothetical protein VNF71_15145 [Acidimicrobiales bacterium]|nr:hypothetical protein [Acidimicrobiales bacterium]
MPLLSLCRAGRRRLGSPSAISWSPGCRTTRSPSTTCSRGSRLGSPSRSTVAVGATSAERRSSDHFARTSCTILIDELETKIPRKGASCQEPKARVIPPKKARNRLKTVKTLARTMPRQGRPDPAGSDGPPGRLPRRARSRLQAPARADFGLWIGQQPGVGVETDVTADLLEHRRP